MHLVCVGISHHTAGVELREKLALDAGDVDRALVELVERYPQIEVAILSTCNRTEVYVARPLHGHPRAEQLTEWLAQRHQTDLTTLGPALYHFDNERAIRHLFRVVSGLDSMVVGESQIAAQVKAAYDAAQRAETVGKALHRVFQSALATGKRVRSGTGLSEGRFSVAGAAVEFARHLFESMQDKTVLLLGAGKMAELTARHFAALAPRRLVVCNRTVERAAKLAGELSGEASGMDQLAQRLAEADVVISSTGADAAVVTHEMMKGVTRSRRYRPMFMIDIAMPRDIESTVADLANVYLFDLDDLQQAVSADDTERHEQLGEAEQLVEQAVGECYALIQTGDVSDLIRRLRVAAARGRRTRTARTLNKLLANADPDDFERIIEQHSHRLINRILHRPLAELGKGDSHTAALYATALRRLFKLDDEDLEQPEDSGKPHHAAPGQTK